MKRNSLVTNENRDTPQKQKRNENLKKHIFECTIHREANMFCVVSANN